MSDQIIFCLKTFDTCVAWAEGKQHRFMISSLSSFYTNTAGGASIQSRERKEDSFKSKRENNFERVNELYVDRPIDFWELDETTKIIWFLSWTMFCTLLISGIWHFFDERCVLNHLLVPIFTCFTHPQYSIPTRISESDSRTSRHKRYIRLFIWQAVAIRRPAFKYAFIRGFGGRIWCVGETFRKYSQELIECHT